MKFPPIHSLLDASRGIVEALEYFAQHKQRKNEALISQVAGEDRKKLKTVVSGIPPLCVLCL